MIFGKPSAGGEYNTTVPADTLLAALWNYSGDFFAVGGNFLATAIGKRLFVTVDHAAAQAGDFINYRGQKYNIVAATVKDDIRLLEVDRDVPAFAEIWRGEDFLTEFNSAGESINKMYLMGLGGGRGSFHYTNAVHDGYIVGTNYAKRWCLNTIVHVDLNPEKTLPIVFSNFMWAQDDNAHLTGGDSGGPAYVKIDGRWKLMGVNTSSSSATEAIYGRPSAIISPINRAWATIDAINAKYNPAPTKPPATSGTSGSSGYSGSQPSSGYSGASGYSPKVATVKLNNPHGPFKLIIEVNNLDLKVSIYEGQGASTKTD